VVFSTAIIVAILLSVSFMTIIPLMKVMLGQEGLHGWVDRKACDWIYGVSVYLPDAMDIQTGDASDLSHTLWVTGVEEGSLAHRAALRSGDRIVGVGDHMPSEDEPRIAASKMLEEMATSDANRLAVKLKPYDEGNVTREETLFFVTPSDEDFLRRLDWSRVRRTRWSLKLALVEKAQWAVGFLPREQAQANKTDAVVFLILAMAVITVIRCLAKFYQGYMAHKVMQVAISRMREDVFGHAIEMPMGFFASERPTDTISRIIRDTNVMASSIKTLLGRALREPMNALFMLICAMLLSWQLVLIFLCMAPFVLGLIALFGKKMKRATKKSLVAGSQMLAKLNGVMGGLKVVKVYNQQAHERGSFKTINRRLLSQLLKIAKVNAATTPTLEVFGMIGGAMALVVGVHWITQSTTTANRIEAPEFFALLALLGAAAESVRKASGVWNRIQEANAAAERVFAVIDEPVEDELPNAPTLEPVKDKIEFVDVTFTYPGERAQVLKGVNLTVQAGHNVAIVGPNGSGKTTLANLVPRLYDPDSGRILIDGSDIRQASLVSLRSQIAMVTQNIVTFNDTIEANIAYGKTDATAEELAKAARQAYAHEFISTLPQGYDTLIGEQGTGLSGGQLQRIVIARAILKDPAILIFDEATSQVDADSEAKIHNAIEEVMRNRTTFIIAHRFSTVISADVIVVMDDGRIVAQGQHAELMQACRLYQSLCETQLVKQ
ncbi:MAG: ABC transporter ATP-binding protein, partial [Planctomycetota bacterium]|jgi:ABC-type multidrug transport system fused ATPase/permease subunit